MKNMWVVGASVVLVVLIIVVMCIGMYAARRLNPDDPRNLDRQSKAIENKVREKFDTVAMSSIRHAKNDRYGKYLVPYFAYDDGGVGDHKIMFHPSIVDVACKTMEDNIGDQLECRSAHVDTLSIQDRESSVGMHTYDTCNSMAVSREPVDHRDASVRIMGGYYKFLKSCVRVSYSGLENDGDSLRLSIPTEAPSTLFIVLARPVFLVANGTKLYQVSLSNPESMIEHVSNSTSTVDIKLTPLDSVDASYIWDSNEADLETIYDEGGGLMNCTLYYLRYESPARTGLVAQNLTTINVISLCFRMTKERMNTETNWFSYTAENGKHLSVKRIEASGDDMEEHEVEINTDDRTNTSTPLKMKVPNHGYLIVTYTRNLLMVCFMNREVCRFITKNVQALDMDSNGNRSTLVTEIATKRVGFPVTCFPINSFSVPNLHDLYSKLIAFS